VNIAIRVVRRLVRKIVKPIALWLNARRLAAAEDRADYLMHLRADIVPLEKAERVRSVQLIGQRNQIRGW
jgi:hypothetical protein